MKIFFIKLLLGKRTGLGRTTPGTIRRRLNNIQAIWDNHHDEDHGLEKLVRLFLASSPLLFLGTYWKTFFDRWGSAYRDLSVDLLVLLKTSLPILTLYLGWQHHDWLFGLILWFFFETMLYVPTLIFASDIFPRPRSYRRSMLLLFFNYFEIVFSFAVIYARGHYLNKDFTHWFDPIYFSFITSSTIGFGDLVPVTPMGKALVTAQSVIFFIFVVLFLNFFSNKMEHRGYFDPTQNK
jgi:Ion channel